ncbi:hypothetical protein HYU94_04055 [Candidatus Daviesbacteria bacterium]|nr:hypothetical protein [Candidatus Daviesbacteria bacterium]
MKVILQPHLKLRLEQRKIPQNYPYQVIVKPESKYFDNVTGHLIAVKRLKYNEKLRPMAVAYDIIDDTIQVITIHPVSDQEINNKLLRERWVKDEKN